MRNLLLKVLERITKVHERALNYLSKKSKQSVWFTILLALYVIWEIIEYTIIPIALILWGVLK